MEQEHLYLGRCTRITVIKVRCTRIPTPDESRTEEAFSSETANPTAAANLKPEVNNALTNNQLEEVSQLASARGPSRAKYEDLYNTNEEPLPSPKANTVATDSPEYEMLLWKKANAINTSLSKAAINSPQRKQWEDATMDKEMRTSDDHEVYNLVLITRVPRKRIIIGSHVILNQGILKARLLL